MSRLFLERDGQRVSLQGWLDGDAWHALAGLTGTGMPAEQVRWFAGAGDGRVFRGVRADGRVVTVPLLLTGPTDGAILAELARLGSLLSARAGNGLPRLVVEAADGSVWWLPVVRREGGEFAWWTDQGGEAGRRVWLRTGLVLESGSPWWTAESAVERAVTVGGSGEGLLDPYSLAELQLSDGQAFGEVEIVNPGDAPAVLRVLVTGPGSDIELVSPDGVSVEWGGTLGTGETLTFDFEAGTVVDGTGANAYSDLVVGKARFWSLPPGVSMVSVGMTGTDQDSEIRLQWFPRRQAVV